MDAVPPHHPHHRRQSRPPASRWSSPLSGGALFAATDSGGDSGADGDEMEEEEERAMRKRSKTRAGSFVERRTSVSSPASSSSECASSKPRKPTYLLQKEERDELVEEARLLEARLELLKIRAGLPTVNDKNSVANIQAASFQVEEEIHANLLKLARFQSLLTRQLVSTPVCPMKTSIHLPADAGERKRILLEMKDFKLRRAAEVAMDRLHYMDQTKPYIHEERFATPDGLNHMKFFQIQQFDGLRDARQLYDALLYFQSNLEISVTEMIGQLTLREDTESDDPTIWNHRIVTTGELGGAEELNVAGFARFYDHYMPHHGAQFGIMVLDTVDEDDLYPYKPRERTHKDYQAGYAISEYREPDSNELVVVLKTCVFMIQLPPEFPLPAPVFEKLLENMPRWIHVMNKFLRDHVHAFA